MLYTVKWSAHSAWNVPDMVQISEKVFNCINVVMFGNMFFVIGSS